MRLLKRITYRIASFIIFIDRFIPKHQYNNRGVVFMDTNVGVGDIVMYMPAIQGMLDLGLELTLYCKKHPQIDILKKHFPNCSFKIRGKYGFTVNNFQSMYAPLDIWRIIKLRTPLRYGHDCHHWGNLLTHIVPFSRDVYQVDANDVLLRSINPYISKSYELFFDVEKLKFIKLPNKYIVIAPFSGKNRKKEYPLYEDIVKKSKLPVVILGNKDEGVVSYPCINLLGLTNIFETAWIIKNSSHFYCNEGGLGHIAAAVKANTTIFHKEGRCNRGIHSNLSNIKYIKF
jgi:ADP-heptose:LPS heptosyltransferase